MIKELFVLTVIFGLSSAKVITKNENDVDKRAFYPLEKRSQARSILEDALDGDATIFDEKRAADFDNALAFYDYITDINKRAVCAHFFPGLCPKLARGGYCRKGRRDRKARFAAKYCAWACGGCK